MNKKVMNSDELVGWLNGFFDLCDENTNELSTKQLKAIKEKLKEALANRTTATKISYKFCSWLEILLKNENDYVFTKMLEEIRVELAEINKKMLNEIPNWASGCAIGGNITYYPQVYTYGWNGNLLDGNNINWPTTTYTVTNTPGYATNTITLKSDK